MELHLTDYAQVEPFSSDYTQVGLRSPDSTQVGRSVSSLGTAVPAGPDWTVLGQASRPGEQDAA